MPTTTLRQCRRCKRIEVPCFVVKRDPVEMVWKSPPDCFEPNLAVTLCLCPACDPEQAKVE